MARTYLISKLSHPDRQVESGVPLFDVGHEAVSGNVIPVNSHKVGLSELKITHEKGRKTRIAHVTAAIASSEEILSPRHSIGVGTCGGRANLIA